MTDHRPITLTDAHLLLVTEHLVAVNKEPGWPVHATRDPRRPNLEGALASRLGEPVAAVHRLDVWTSGVVLLARTGEGRRRLTAMFENRTVVKLYEAVCVGRPDPPEGTLKHYLAKRREAGRDVMRSVRSGGKVALTDYTTVGTGRTEGADLALVELRPRTGRTHQLRVQAAEAGWPVLDDVLYGGQRSRSDLDGQLLHARSLVFDDPWTGDQVVIEAQPYDRFERIASALRESN
jgi:RluA family pseudouridine synthase